MNGITGSEGNEKHKLIIGVLRGGGEEVEEE